MYTTLVAAEQLFAHLNDPEWLIFDCRFDLANTEKGCQAYAEAHIPGAFYAHLDEQLSSPITPQSGRHPLPDMNSLTAWLANCGMQSNRQVVVYDDSGGAMAVRLWWLLRCLGHQKVALLDGGWPRWVSSGYQTSESQPQASVSTFQAAFNPQSIVNTDQVVDNVENPVFQIVDVRAEERFMGIAEPIDPVAGHIPDAINVPLTLNLEESGLYKSADELRDMYAPLVEKCPVEQQVYMCGSGVTACHSVLAVSVAGLGFPRVYAGSWSEWIRDASRPVVTSSAD